MEWNGRSGEGCREGEGGVGGVGRGKAEGGNESLTLRKGLLFNSRLKDVEEESTLRDWGRLFQRAGAEDLKERAPKRVLLVLSSKLVHHQRAPQWGTAD